MLQKVIKVGNSVAITLPKDFLDNARVKAGDIVHVEVDKSTDVMVVSSKENPLMGISPDIAQWAAKFIKNNLQALKELANK